MNFIKKIVVCVVFLSSVAALLPVTAAAQQAECHIQGDSEQAIAEYGQCLSRARERVAQARTSLESAAVATPPRRRSQEVPAPAAAPAVPAPVQPAAIRVQPLSRQATGPVAPLRSLAPRSAPQVETQAVVVPPLASAAPAPQAPVQQVVQASAPQPARVPVFRMVPEVELPPIMADTQLQPTRGTPPHDRTFRMDRTAPCLLITNMTGQHRDASVAGRGLSRNRGGRVDYPFAVSLLDSDGRPIVFRRHQQTPTTQGWRSLVLPGRSACIPVCPTRVRVSSLRRACVGVQDGGGGSFHFNLWLQMPDGTYALVTYRNGRGVQGNIPVEGTGEYILQHSHIEDPDAWNSRQPLTR